MAVNNAELIKPLMHFDVDGDIYFIEIIRRGKDIGSTGERLIRDYHIHSIEQLDETMPEIAKICDENHARAYIRVNVRNIEDCNIYAQIEMLREQLTRNQTVRKAMKTGNMNTFLKDKLNRIRSATKIYGSVLGKYSSDDEKKWIIDIDTDQVNPEVPGMESVAAIADTYTKFINDCCEPLGVNKVLARIPSRTGMHLVTRGFNKSTFSAKYGKEKVMDDGITNLYIAD